jgi:hypothetical protein
MDIIQHAAWSAPLTLAINKVLPLGETFWPVLATLAVFGALPDIIGWVDKLVHRNHNLWNWYLWAHNYPWYLCIVPTYLFHVFLDSFTHEDGKRWWIPGERLSYEITAWVVLIILTFIGTI